MNKTQRNKMCDKHQEYYTNFCCETQCLCYLCPECILEHQAFHKQQNVFPIIESIKSMRITCFNKVQTAIHRLQQETNECNLDYLIEPDKIIAKGQEQINRRRAQILAYVNNYFDEMQETYKHRINQNLLKASGLQSVFDKINDVISELEYIGAELQDFQNFKSGMIKKVCQLDLEKLVSRSKEELITQTESKNLDAIKIVSNDNKLDELSAYLKGFCFIYHDNIRSSMINEGEKQAFHNMEQLNLSQNLQSGLIVSKNDQQFQSKYDDNQIDRQSKFSKIEQTPQNTKNEKQSKSIIQNKLYESQKRQILKSQIQFENQLDNIKIQSDLNLENTFSNEQLTKLHFFQHDSKNFYQYKLSNKNQIFQKIDLKINFQIPLFHKSICTQDDKIFLIGGKLFETQQRSGTIYLLDYQNKTLIEKAQLQIPRSSFCVSYLHPFIYVIGGFDNNAGCILQCEKFNVETNQVSTFGMLNISTSVSSACSFNKKYIYKFGGYMQDTSLAQAIEKYDLEKQINWQIVTNIQFQGIPNGFQILASSAAVQVSENEIMIIGGYDEQNIGHSKTFVFNPKENCLMKYDNFGLPNAEGFWNPQPIIHDNFIYILQNKCDQHSNNCLEDQRNVLIFNHNAWKYYF